jgi:hypothetical protein
MNTVPTMKIVTLLTRVALASVVALTLAVALDLQPLALFSVAAGALFALIVANDYAPRHRDRVAVAATVIDFSRAPVRTKRESRPLAA